MRFLANPTGNLGLLRHLHHPITGSAKGGNHAHRRQEIASGIEVSPDGARGAPVLKDTRIPVRAIIRALADRESAQEVAQAYEIRQEQVKQALRYAPDRIEEVHEPPMNGRRPALPR